MIPTSNGFKTPAQIVDALIYSSFAANRDEGMTAEKYGGMLKMDTSKMEAQYQAEKQP